MPTAIERARSHRLVVNAADCAGRGGQYSLQARRRQGRTGRPEPAWITRPARVQVDIDPGPDRLAEHRRDAMHKAGCCAPSGRTYGHADRHDRERSSGLNDRSVRIALEFGRRAGPVHDHGAVVGADVHASAGIGRGRWQIGRSPARVGSRLPVDDVRVSVPI
jgi:hypothetical protein